MDTKPWGREREDACLGNLITDKALTGHDAMGWTVGTVGLALAAVLVTARGKYCRQYRSLALNYENCPLSESRGIQVSSPGTLPLQTFLGDTPIPFPFP